MKEGVICIRESLSYNGSDVYIPIKHCEKAEGSSNIEKIIEIKEWEIV